MVERQIFDLGDGEAWESNPGDLLFEERFDQAALDQQFTDLGEGPYNAQILQRPSPPGGALFKLKHFQRYETAPKYYEAIHQSWDPGDRRHRNRGFLRLHDLGHPRPQALLDRRMQSTSS